MKSFGPFRILKVVAVCAAAAVTPSLAAAQANTGDASRKSPAKLVEWKTPWGDPDLQGTWSSDDTIGIPMQRPDEYGTKLFLTDDELAEKVRRDETRQRAVAGSGSGGPPGAAVGPPDHWGERPTKTLKQTSLVVDPPDGKIPPFTDAARRRAAGRDRGSFGDGPFNGPEDFTNYDRCITRSVLGSLIARPYGNGFQLVQSPGSVTLTHEMIHETRIIPLDGRPHVGSAIRQYVGDSRGHWEGRTLVVDTTNFTNRTSIGLNGNGLRHSQAMRLVERFTRVDADTIQYEVTIEDLETYAQLWKMAFPLTTRAGYQIFEYACHEGNYGLDHILRAARAAERENP